ncbi:hypothetical protein RHGRI_038197 [Rhododendron griersonianum]|uniref:RNase H type-1 domain-containing protein n=1 Tax=Rhododendron griersonianum TaxID=479676 RepID=A0AAV6HVE7_9ERIC|nr:hypothetical protein RHGRI_038197 [Rhododendron griersonianum]
MVIRDWQGNFIAARAIQRQRTTDPLLVEALAARECVKLARDLGINKIIIEGDCQQLTRMLQHHREEHRTVGVIVADRAANEPSRVLPCSSLFIVFNEPELELSENLTSRARAERTLA